MVEKLLKEPRKVGVSIFIVVFSFNQRYTSTNEDEFLIRVANPCSHGKDYIYTAYKR